MSNQKSKLPKGYRIKEVTRYLVIDPDGDTLGIVSARSAAEKIVAQDQRYRAEPKGTYAAPRHLAV